MPVIPRWLRACSLAVAVALSGCGTVATLGKLEEGASAEAVALWDRWIERDGDIAAATTWERKVQPGVTVNDIEQILLGVAAERNMKEVGQLPLSRELETRTGQPQKFLKVYSFCTPTTARAMVDFSPHLAAFLPCRISVVEQSDGLWLYTLNMDMMVKMGRKLPPALKAEAMAVRDSIHLMMERASKGEI